MTDKEKFGQLLAACRRRDPQATARLVRLCLPYLQTVVRHRLNDDLRYWYDSVDFTQDVWKSFFRAAISRNIRSEEDLLLHLATMAKNKIVDEIRHQTSERIGGECLRVKLELDGLASPDPTPSKAVAAEEEWKRMLIRVPPEQRLMLEMIRAGHTREEVSEKFGIPLRTLRRLLRRLDPNDPENSSGSPP